MKTNVKTYKVQCWYEYEVTDSDHEIHKQEIELDDRERDEEELDEEFRDALWSSIAKNNPDIEILDIYDIQWELLSDSIPPAEVMRREGQKGLFDDQTL